MTNPTWEYDSIDSLEGDELEKLDALGKHGWELVAVRPSPIHGLTRFYFKRRTG